MKTLGWVALILGGALVIALVWARSQGKSLADLFRGVTGNANGEGPPIVPDTYLTDPTHAKPPGVSDVVGEVAGMVGYKICKGYGLSESVCNQAAGLNAKAFKLYVDAHMKAAGYTWDGVKWTGSKVGTGLGHVGNGIKAGAQTVWGWLT